jgi:6-phosphogluconolactonase (cycloisomerase 2 family)
MPVHATEPVGEFPAPTPDHLYVVVAPLDDVGPAAVIAFEVDDVGFLTQEETYETGGLGRGYASPQGIVTDASVRFLFAGNNVSEDIAVFAIEDDGELAPVAGSPFAARGTPAFLAIHDEADFLYAGQGTGVGVYGFDANGSLAELQTVSIQGWATGLEVRPGGEFLYVADLFGAVRGFGIAGDGTLTEIAGSPFPYPGGRPWDVEISFDGSRLYLLDLDSGVAVFDVDDGGALHERSDSPVPLDEFPGTFALTGDARFVYVGPAFSPTIEGFASDPDGDLTEIAGSPFVGDYTPAALLDAAETTRLYEVAQQTRQTTLHNILEDGSLEPATAPFPVSDVSGRVPNGAAYVAVVLAADLDIKPGSDPNAINLRSGGVVAVAVLGSDSLDVSDIRTESLRFGPWSAGPTPRGTQVKDVDGDGLPDLVAHFRTRETGLDCRDREATLQGELVTGRAIAGTDSVAPRGCR